MSRRSKPAAELQAIEENPVSNTLVVWSVWGVSQSDMVRHLDILSCWTVSQVNEILQKFWLTQVDINISGYPKYLKTFDSPK